VAQATSGRSGATQPSALTAEREHSQFPGVFLGYITRLFVLAKADEETTTKTCGTALVQRFGVHNFHKAVIVSVIHGNADQHRSLHSEGLP
jgi:hypothetical protein